jgi:hypothetical protein
VWREARIFAKMKRITHKLLIIKNKVIINNQYCVGFLQEQVEDRLMFNEKYGSSTAPFYLDLERGDGGDLAQDVQHGI